MVAHYWFQIKRSSHMAWVPAVNLGAWVLHVALHRWAGILTWMLYYTMRLVEAVFLLVQLFAITSTHPNIKKVQPGRNSS